MSKKQTNKQTVPKPYSGIDFDWEISFHNY